MGAMLVYLLTIWKSLLPLDIFYGVFGKICGNFDIGYVVACKIWQPCLSVETLMEICSNLVFLVYCTVQNLAALPECRNFDGKLRFESDRSDKKVGKP
jgi:hypothetical protein